MGINLVSFDDVLAHLDAAIGVCDALGLADQVRRCRFAQYRRTVLAAIDRVRCKRARSGRAIRRCGELLRAIKPGKNRFDRSRGSGSPFQSRRGARRRAFHMPLVGIFLQVVELSTLAGSQEELVGSDDDRTVMPPGSDSHSEMRNALNRRGIFPEERRTPIIREQSRSMRARITCRPKRWHDGHRTRTRVLWPNAQMRAGMGGQINPNDT